jgi:hypothetical protein
MNETYFFRFCSGICKRPRFKQDLALSPPGSPPSPSLWECGNPRLMRVSKRRGMSCLGLSTVDPARHFHSELTDSAHFGERRASGTPHEQKRHFPKSRVDWSFLQIVEQSLFFNIHLKSYALLIKSRRGTHTGAVFFVVDG